MDPHATPPHDAEVPEETLQYDPTDTETASLTTFAASVVEAAAQVDALADCSREVRADKIDAVRFLVDHMSRTEGKPIVINHAGVLHRITRRTSTTRRGVTCKALSDLFSDADKVSKHVQSMGACGTVDEMLSKSVCASLAEMLTRTSSNVIASPCARHAETDETDEIKEVSGRLCAATVALKDLTPRLADARRAYDDLVRVMPVSATQGSLSPPQGAEEDVGGDDDYDEHTDTDDDRSAKSPRIGSPPAPPHGDNDSDGQRVSDDASSIADFLSRVQPHRQQVAVQVEGREMTLKRATKKRSTPMPLKAFVDRVDAVAARIVADRVAVISGDVEDVRRIALDCMADVSFRNCFEAALSEVATADRKVKESESIVLRKKPAAKRKRAER